MRALLPLLPKPRGSLASLRSHSSSGMASMKSWKPPWRAVKTRLGLQSTSMSCRVAILDVGEDAESVANEARAARNVVALVRTVRME